MEKNRIAFALYLFPLVALCLQIVALQLTLPRLALLALVVPLIFIPQVALWMRRRWAVPSRRLVVDSLLSIVLVLLASLMML